MTRSLFGEPKIADSFSPEETIILHQGDVLEFLKTLPTNFVTLVVTSPPYNLGKEYEQKRALEVYLDEQAAIIAELIRVLKDDGSICWEVGNFVDEGEIFPLDVFFYDIFKNGGLHLRNRIIWHFGHGLHASKRFSGRYETILWFTKTDEYVFNLDHVRIPSKYPGKTHFKGPKRGTPSANPLGKNPSDVWELISKEWEEGLIDIPNVKANHPEKTIHPCQFPIELVERCVLALTNEGDWLFDPYSGVGSSLIAGIKHRRKVLGCEKEAEYVNIARDRIEQFAVGKLKIRKLGTPVYQPTGREKVAQRPAEWSKSTEDHLR
jgi:DNA modification methylase